MIVKIFFSKEYLVDSRIIYSTSLSLFLIFFNYKNSTEPSSHLLQLIIWSLRSGSNISVINSLWSSASFQATDGEILDPLHGNGPFMDPEFGPLHSVSHLLLDALIWDHNTSGPSSFAAWVQKWVVLQSPHLQVSGVKAHLDSFCFSFTYAQTHHFQNKQNLIFFKFS